MNMDINSGYGFVSGILYPNLFVYLPAVLLLLGMSLISAYKFWILLINIATALVGYYSFSKLFKSNKMGAICACLYLINPYRVINIFVRAAIGEVLAEIFLPLLVYALVEVLYREQKKWFTLVIAVTGILQSHILTLEMCLLFVLFFVAISWKQFIKKDGWYRILSCIKAAAVTILLNLWFLIPFLDHFVKKYNLLGEVRDMSMYALNLYQMFMNNFKAAGINIMPLTIGITLLIGSIIFIYFAYVCRILPENHKKIGSIALCLGIFSCYMVSEYFPWDFLDKNCSGLYLVLSRLQFPWRMLGYASLFLCIVTTVAASALYKKKMYGILIGQALLSILILLQCMDNYIADTNILITGRNQDVSIINTDYYRNDLTGENYQILLQNGGRVITDEAIDIESFKKVGTDLKFNFNRKNADKSTSLELPLYNYSLHNIYLNGNKINEGTGNYGLITVKVPRGMKEGVIEAVYVGRKLYKVGDLCSMLAVIIIGGYIVRNRFNHKTISRV